MSNLTPPNSEPQLLSEFERNLLKKEYFFLQNTIEDYNKQIWVIKALGITGTGGVLALMLQQKPNASSIALIGCVIPLFFWILESQWKHFQRGFYPRAAEIESVFKKYGLNSPSIYSSWTRTFKRTPTPRLKGYLWDGLLNSSVFISYVLEITFLVFMAAAAPKIWK